jgi:hypothetical protein
MRFGHGMLARLVTCRAINWPERSLTSDTALELVLDLLGAAPFEWIGTTGDDQ